MPPAGASYHRIWQKHGGSAPMRQASLSDQECITAITAVMLPPARPRPHLHGHGHSCKPCGADACSWASQGRIQLDAHCSLLLAVHCCHKSLRCLLLGLHRQQQQHASATTPAAIFQCKPTSAGWCRCSTDAAQAVHRVYRHWALLPRAHAGSHEAHLHFSFPQHAFQAGCCCACLFLLLLLLLRVHMEPCLEHLHTQPGTCVRTRSACCNTIAGTISSHCHALMHLLPQHVAAGHGSSSGLCSHVCHRNSWRLHTASQQHDDHTAVTASCRACSCLP